MSMRAKNPIIMQVEYLIVLSLDSFTKVSTRIYKLVV